MRPKIFIPVVLSVLSYSFTSSALAVWQHARVNLNGTTRNDWRSGRNQTAYRSLGSSPWRTATASGAGNGYYHTWGTGGSGHAAAHSSLFADASPDAGGGGSGDGGDPTFDPPVLGSQGSSQRLEFGVTELPAGALLQWNPTSFLQLDLDDFSPVQSTLLTRATIDGPGISGAFGLFAAPGTPPHAYGTGSFAGIPLNVVSHPGNVFSVQLPAPMSWTLTGVFDNLEYGIGGNVGVELPGDFNFDGSLTGADIDMLHTTTAGTVFPADPLFDLNNDHVVNKTHNATGSDADLWVHGLKHTQYGDVNLDGLISFDDLLSLAQHYGSATGGWAEGNVDGAPGINFGDLLVVAQNYGFGPLSRSGGDFAADWVRAQALAPEPTGLLALALLTRTPRRRR